MPFEQSPRVANALLTIVICLSLALALVVGYRAGHQENRAVIHPCAAVLQRGEEQVCR